MNGEVIDSEYEYVLMENQDCKEWHNETILVGTKLKVLALRKAEFIRFRANDELGS